MLSGQMVSTLFGVMVVFVSRKHLTRLCLAVGSAALIE
jgi:hypothetical protein